MQHNVLNHDTSEILDVAVAATKGNMMQPLYINLTGDNTVVVRFFFSVTTIYGSRTLFCGIHFKIADHNGGIAMSPLSEFEIYFDTPGCTQVDARKLAATAFGVFSAAFPGYALAMDDSAKLLNENTSQDITCREISICSDIDTREFLPLKIAQASMNMDNVMVYRCNKRDHEIRKPLSCKKCIDLLLKFGTTRRMILGNTSS